MQTDFLTSHIAAGEQREGGRGRGRKKREGRGMGKEGGERVWAG